MTFAEAMEGAWVLEWHEREGHGALEIYPLRDVVDRNGRMMTEGGGRRAEVGGDRGPLVLGVFLTLEKANEGRREMKRRLREKAAEIEQEGRGG